MKSRVTDEMYASIPTLIGEGKNRQEIADLFGVKVTSLQVMCSQRGISLRPQGKHSPRLPYKVDCPKSIKQIIALRVEAKARGMTTLQLVQRMVEIIVDDKLFDAVLGKAGEIEAPSLAMEDA